MSELSLWLQKESKPSLVSPSSKNQWHSKFPNQVKRQCFRQQIRRRQLSKYFEVKRSELEMLAQENLKLNREQLQQKADISAKNMHLSHLKAFTQSFRVSHRIFQQTCQPHLEDKTNQLLISQNLKDSESIEDLLMRVHKSLIFVAQISLNNQNFVCNQNEKDQFADTKSAPKREEISLIKDSLSILVDMLDPSFVSETCNQCSGYYLLYIIFKILVDVTLKDQQEVHQDMLLHQHHIQQTDRIQKKIETLIDFGRVKDSESLCQQQAQLGRTKYQTSQGSINLTHQFSICWFLNFETDLLDHIRFYVVFPNAFKRQVPELKNYQLFQSKNSTVCRNEQVETLVLIFHLLRNLSTINGSDLLFEKGLISETLEIREGSCQRANNLIQTQVALFLTHSFSSIRKISTLRFLTQIDSISLLLEIVESESLLKSRLDRQIVATNPASCFQGQNLLEECLRCLYFHILIGQNREIVRKLHEGEEQSRELDLIPIEIRSLAQNCWGRQTVSLQNFKKSQCNPYLMKLLLGENLSILTQFSRGREFAEQFLPIENLLGEYQE